MAEKPKLVSLIQSGKIAAAYELLNKKTSAEKLGDIAFEKAYVYYRLQKNEEAVKELAAATNQKDPGVMELKAQLAYRLGSYEEARNLLIELLKSHSDDFDDLRRANLIAVEAHLQAMGVDCEPQTDLENFEQIYNAACHQIELGNYNEAMELLDEAQKVCRQTLAEDGAPEEEIEEELSAMLVQKAFIYQKLDRNDEAMQIYDAIDAKKPSDVNVQATILNNVQCIPAEPKINEVRKKLKAAMKLDKTKLSKRQLNTIASNLELLKDIARLRCRQNKKKKPLVDEDTEIVTGKLKNRKRKRKVILPKNYDPNVPPDPERWLPMAERSYYKKKKLNKKYKDKHIGKGTQGRRDAA